MGCQGIDGWDPGGSDGATGKDQLTNQDAFRENRSISGRGLTSFFVLLFSLASILVVQQAKMLGC